MTALAALPPLDPREVRPPETQVDRFWRPRVLASHLGLSRQSVYNLIRSGALDSIQIAGSLRIPESSILAYLAQCRAGSK